MQVEITMWPKMTKRYFALILEITPYKGLFVMFVVLHIHLILVHNINMWWIKPTDPILGTILISPSENVALHNPNIVESFWSLFYW